MPHDLKPDKTSALQVRPECGTGGVKEGVLTVRAEPPYRSSPSAALTPAHRATDLICEGGTMAFLEGSNSYTYPE